jgi:hypothetical protein
MTNLLYIFPDPLDSHCELVSMNTGEIIVAIPGIYQGRQGQGFSIGNNPAFPNGNGAIIKVSHPGKVNLEQAGILWLKSGSPDFPWQPGQTAAFEADDFRLSDSSNPVPPDSIDLKKCTIYSSPKDIASWPETVAITGISVSRDNGWAFKFSHILSDSWKWPSNPHDPTDNYQYTVWPVVFINGQWYSAGIVQMWQGRPSTGAFEFPTWHEDFHRNWCYDDVLWGLMASYFPNPGDKFGFFVSAGNARVEGGVTSVRERSNVVEIVLPVGDAGEWSF